MIYNASLLRVDRLTAVAVTGKKIITQGTAIDIRCHAGEITNRLRYSLGQTADDADGMALIEKRLLIAAGITEDLTAGDQLVVQVDGSAAVTRKIMSAKNQVKGSLSHWEVVFQKV